MLEIINIFLHLDKFLSTIVLEYSGFTYFLLFIIIFLETGLVVTPFLPGDSLLFAAGALASLGSLNAVILFLILFIAAVLGDALNYHIGKFIGPKIWNKENSFFFKKEYLIKAQNFYSTHGKKTIILARFIPIIRTFAPFVAGVGNMLYRTFLIYNILGAFLWTSLFIFGGYLFGNIPIIKNNFGIFIIVIIILSLMPLFKALIHKPKKNQI